MIKCYLRFFHEAAALNMNLLMQQLYLSFFCKSPFVMRFAPTTDRKI